MPDIVTLNAVTKDYPLGKTTVHALRGVDLAIGEGEFASIAGPSGSGKTTLLNLIGCVDVATTGQVTVAGQETSSLSDKALTALRLHHIGFIFQTFNLVSVLNVVQNIELPLLLQGKHTPKERQTRRDAIVEAVGLGGQRDQRPSELSGGQRQRVAIARALVTEPKLVLADEPTANLDSETGAQILDLMRAMNKDSVTFLFSTHDPRVMEQAGRIIRISDGVVQAA